MAQVRQVSKLVRPTGKARQRAQVGAAREHVAHIGSLAGIHL